MNVEQLVRESLSEMSEQESPPTPPDFADRVLRVRRKRRIRTFAGVAMATAAVVLAAVAVPMLDGEGETARPADRIGTEDVHAHPDQSPPRELIAAGRTAMSAYTTRSRLEQPNGDVIERKVWHLYNPSTGRYEKTDWAWADVAPGLDKAAVLEGPLPSNRIGIIDLATGEVEQWIPLAEEEAASVFWSPGGRRLLATTYSEDPDRRHADEPVRVNGKEEPGGRPSRTGYAIIDVPSNGGRWFELPYEKTEFQFPGRARSDLGWSADGSLIVESITKEPHNVYYDLDGDKVTPPGPGGISWAPLRISPDGRYLAGAFSGENAKEVSTEVLDARTGKRVAEQPVQELLAWADGNRLFAWGCDPDKCSGKGEFRQQLLLVDVQGKHVRQLTDFRNSQSENSWQPVFSSR